MAEMSQCDQCGKIDDHPKVHIFPDVTKHNDCLGVKERQYTVNSSDPLAAIAVELCESGTKGDELREAIMTHPEHLRQVAAIEAGEDPYALPADSLPTPKKVK